MINSKETLIIGATAVITGAAVYGVDRLVGHCRHKRRHHRAKSEIANTSDQQPEAVNNEEK